MSSQAAIEALGPIPARHDRVHEVRPCHVRGCVDGTHPYVDGTKDDLCFALGIGEGEQNSVFYVAGYRDEDTGRWEAFCEDPDLALLEGAAGLALIERFALAYRTVQEHCTNLNQLERSTR